MTLRRALVLVVLTAASFSVGGAAAGQQAYVLRPLNESGALDHSPIADVVFLSERRFLTAHPLVRTLKEWMVEDGHVIVTRLEIAPWRLFVFDDGIRILDFNGKEVGAYRGGKYVGGQLFSAPAGHGEPFSAVSAHGMLASDRLVGMPGVRGSARTAEVFGIPILTWRVGDTVGDQIAERRVPRSIVARLPGIVRYYSQPLILGDQFTVPPHGGSILLANADSGGYTIRRIDARGREVSRRSYAAPAVSMRAPHVEAVLDSLTHAGSAGDTSVAEIVRQQLQDQLVVPTTYPTVTRIVAGLDGTVWVRREDLPDIETVTWEVLIDGERRGSYQLPKELSVRSVLRYDAIATGQLHGDRQRLWLIRAARSN